MWFVDTVIAQFPSWMIRKYQLEPNLLPGDAEERSYNEKVSA